MRINYYTIIECGAYSLFGYTRSIPCWASQKGLTINESRETDHYVSVNRRVIGVESTLIPDMVVRRGNKTFIIGFTVSCENRPSSLLKAYNSKKTKYEPLARQLASQRVSTLVLPVIVGSFGAWVSDNDKAIKFCWISRNYSTLMKKFMVSDAIAVQIRKKGSDIIIFKYFNFNDIFILI